MTRATTWSNSDNLVVGFGPNYAERIAGGVEGNGNSQKVGRVQITFQSTTGASGAKFTVPAGSVVHAVKLIVGTQWVGGTSIAVGDGGSTGGYITAAQGATANLTAGAVLNSQGAYLYTATEGRLPPKTYAAAGDIYFTVVGTYTAGTAELFVEYT